MCSPNQILNQTGWFICFDPIHYENTCHRRLFLLSEKKREEDERRRMLEERRRGSSSPRLEELGKSKSCEEAPAVRRRRRYE